MKLISDHLVCFSSDLRFYQQIKLVNFIRRQIHQSSCYGCQEKFDSKAEVLGHIQAQGHVMKLPDVSTWDQPQYVQETSSSYDWSTL